MSVTNWVVAVIMFGILLEPVMRHFGRSLMGSISVSLPLYREEKRWYVLGINVYTQRWNNSTWWDD